jgi:hypothetical protein
MYSCLLPVGAKLVGQPEMDRTRMYHLMAGLLTNDP